MAELDIEREKEALAAGDSCFVKGEVEDAEKLYREVLLHNPMSPIGQYKLAMLLHKSSRSAASLVHFQTAIILDPRCVFFRLDYIEALIEEGEHERAVQESKAAQDIDDCVGTTPSLANERLNHFELEQFYKRASKDIASSAIQGWLFAENFDSVFINRVDSDFKINEKPKSSTRVTNSTSSGDMDFVDASDVLLALNEEQDLDKKYQLIKSLIENQHSSLTRDSFGDRGIFTLKDVLWNLSASGKISIVIVGGGVTGLYLACTLKNTLKDAVGILVLDNRSDRRGVRKVFDRNWLTHIPSRSVDKLIPESIRNITSCLGEDGYIGLPLNAIETILMLSCKDQGVKFYFSHELEFLSSNLHNTSLVFDATGGRLNATKQYSSEPEQYSIDVTAPPMNHSSSGIMPTKQKGFSPTNPFRVSLRHSGGIYYPYTDDGKLSYFMLKLTGIPAQLLPRIRSFAEDKNADNIFYIWEGHLKKSINEGLVFINLTASQAGIISSKMQYKLKLKDFAKEASGKPPFFDPRALQLFKILQELDDENSINIEPPFSYNPYIHMLNEIGTIGGSNIYPIGDSIYCGHPKQGNGLGFHLKFINELVIEIKRLAEERTAS